MAQGPMAEGGGDAAGRGPPQRGSEVPAAEEQSASWNLSRRATAAENCKQNKTNRTKQTKEAPESDLQTRENQSPGGRALLAGQSWELLLQK